MHACMCEFLMVFVFILFTLILQTALTLKLVNEIDVLNRHCTGDRSSVVGGIPLEQHLEKLEELTALALSEDLH